MVHKTEKNPCQVMALFFHYFLTKSIFFTAIFDKIEA